MPKLSNALTQLLGTRLPIIQAPMAGGITTPALVAAAGNAGALGSFGFAYTQPEAMARDIEAAGGRALFHCTDVLREAEKLVAAGVKELLVISQDTSAYGIDLKYASSKWRDKDVRAKFLDLASSLGELGAWVRLHYVYPYPHVDDVIEFRKG